MQLLWVELVELHAHRKIDPHVRLESLLSHQRLLMLTLLEKMLLSHGGHSSGIVLV